MQNALYANLQGNIMNRDLALSKGFLYSGIILVSIKLVILLGTDAIVIIFGLVFIILGLIFLISGAIDE